MPVKGPGKIACVPHPAPRINPAKLFDAHLFRAQAADKIRRIHGLVFNGPGEFLHIELLQFPGNLLRGAVPVKVVGRPVKDNVQCLALGQIHGGGAEDRQACGPHTGGNQMSLVSGEYLPVTVGKDRSKESEFS